MNLLLTVSETPIKIPDSEWLRFGIILLVLLALLQTARLISRQNRYVVLFVVVVGGTGLMASWVHNRNEPSFLSPMVDIVEPWFPKRLRTHTASSALEAGQKTGLAAAERPAGGPVSG